MNKVARRSSTTSGNSRSAQISSFGVTKRAARTAPGPRSLHCSSAQSRNASAAVGNLSAMRLASARSASLTRCAAKSCSPGLWHQHAPPSLAQAAQPLETSFARRQVQALLVTDLRRFGKITQKPLERLAGAHRCRTQHQIRRKPKFSQIAADNGRRAPAAFVQRPQMVALDAQMPRRLCVAQ